MTNDNRLLSDAVAAMGRSDDVADALAHVLAGCVEAYPSAAAAVLVRNGAGSLDLLAASSHRAEELELLQIQHRHGPCVEAMNADAKISAAGREDLIARWGSVGAAIAEAGFVAVHAFPMHWRGTTIGGLNIFATTDQASDPLIGQLFADLATLAVLRRDELREEQLRALIVDAVSARAVIEQAKGVLAYRENLDMDVAYAELVSRARTDGTELTTTARRIVEAQHRNPEG